MAATERAFEPPPLDQSSRGKDLLHPKIQVTKMVSQWGINGIGDISPRSAISQSRVTSVEGIALPQSLLIELELFANASLARIRIQALAPSRARILLAESIVSGRKSSLAVAILKRLHHLVVAVHAVMNVQL
jgi:hypothetical protein